MRLATGNSLNKRDTRERNPLRRNTLNAQLSLSIISRLDLQVLRARTRAMCIDGKHAFKEFDVNNTLFLKTVACM